MAENLPSVINILKGLEPHKILRMLATFASFLKYLKNDIDFLSFIRIRSLHKIHDLPRPSPLQYCFPYKMDEYTAKGHNYDLKLFDSMSGGMGRRRGRR